MWIINIQWKARSHFLPQNLFIFISINKVVIKIAPFILIFGAVDL